MDATDRLCRMLDELGVEHEDADISVGEKAYGATTYWECGDVVARFSEKADAGTLLEAWDVTPEQAISATVGRGNLTAEQVREAIMSADRWRKPMGDTGMTNTHLIIRDDGWQAIADELNATVGAGMCHVKAAKKLGDLFGFSLSCGHSMVNQFDDRPDYCPWCGAKVMDE